MTKKILLADDSLTIQKVVELTFSDSEYELICVSNGQRALDKIGEQRPDLVLADVVMPEKNGYEVCEAIKSNPATARIPVVLLSGTFEPFDRDRAERLGCDAIVSKPFDSQQLLRQVEALLSRPAGEVVSAATMAIPIPKDAFTAPPSTFEPSSPSDSAAAGESAASAAPATSAPAGAAPPGSAESGFAADDFTGSSRVPTPISGGTDLFEEEYGQGDVESAIAAFEKAHPEFAGVEEAEEDYDDNETGEVEPLEEVEAQAPLASWLSEDSESPSPAESRTGRPMPPPAPFWVPREPEPDVQPIPFSADDSASRRPSRDVPPPASEPLRAEPEPLHSAPEPLHAEREPLVASATPLDASGAPMRADEMPTQQIPLSHDYLSLRPNFSDERSGANEGSGAPAKELEERTAEIPVSEYRSPAEVRPPEPAAPAAATGGTEAAMDSVPASPAGEPAPVSREIEVLAQTTSIGQLNEMLSSVSRASGELSDEEIDRLAQRVVQRISERILREIAWEVIPDVAELVIKQRIKELEAGVE